MAVMDWLFCILASWQIVETLRHGSIFTRMRRWGNKNLDSSNYLVALAAKLCVCPFCLSHWAPWLPLLVCLYGNSWMRLPVYALSITRMTQLANDVFHSYSRSPSAEEDLVVEEKLV